ncbi:MAG: ABC transporter permease subunit [Acidimicrobiaceae bacterium]|nr:ABC transporter permease subunit [Acidimicrobiaceae bacterium]
MTTRTPISLTKSGIRGNRRHHDGKGVAPMIGLLPIAILLVIWQFLGNPHSVFFPLPSHWWTAIQGVEQQGNLWSSILATSLTFIESIIVAALIGTSLGIALGSIRWGGKALDPLLDFLRNLPAAALVPAAAIVLGTNTKMALVIVVLSSIWPILLNTRAEIQNLSPVLSSSIINLRLSGWHRLSVMIGSALPGILLGIRVAAPLALIVTLLAEFITNLSGVGALILSAQQNFNSAEVYALLVVAGLLALAVNSLVSAIEASVLRRHGPST